MCETMINISENNMIENSVSQGSHCCGDCSHCSIERHLAHLATKTGSAKSLLSIWVLDKKEISEKINKISRPFLTYSDHGPTHSEKILEHIGKILGDRLCLLSATDTFLLLEVAYRHDIGMFVSYGEMVNALDQPDFKKKLAELKFSSDKEIREAAYYISERQDMFNKDSIKERIKWSLKSEKSFSLVLSEYFRQQHAARSENLINSSNDFASNNIIISRISKIIAKICSGHTADIGSILKLPQFEEGLDNDSAHPRFIQVLLRLGDLLDLDNNRFSPHLLAQWGGDELISTKAHKVRHEAVEHFHVSPDKIEVIARFLCDEPKRTEEGGDNDDNEILLTSKTEANFKSQAKKLAEEIEKAIKEQKIRESDIINFINSKKEFCELSAAHRKYEDERQKEHLIKNNACIIAANWFNWLDSELDFFARNWSLIVPKNFPLPVPRLTEREIWWQDQKLDLKTFDLKYEISQKRAFSIIADTGLYTNDIINDLNTADKEKSPSHFIFLRELVQNAMDSTKLQVFRYLKEGRYGNALEAFGNDIQKWKLETVLPEIGDYIKRLSVNVHIHYYSNGDMYKIEVKDVGTGINEIDLKNMSRIGDTRTPEKDREIDSMPSWLRPNGSFGIGMQSIFGVVNEFCAVSSSRIDHKVRDLYFDSLNFGGGLFAVETKHSKNLNAPEYGTKIIVKISQEQLEKLEQESGEPNYFFHKNFMTRFNKIDEQIKQVMGRDLFPIHVRYFVDDVELLHRSNKGNFPCAFKALINKENGTFSNYLPLNISSDCDNPVTFLYYHDNKNILLRLKLRDVSSDKYSIKNIWGETDFYFRGMRVPGVKYLSQMVYPCWDMEVYLWDYKPEDILKINRNFIQPEKVKEIAKIVLEAANAAIARFVNYLCAMENDEYVTFLNKLSAGQRNALGFSLFCTKIISHWSTIDENGISQKCSELLNKNELYNNELKLQIYEYEYGELTRGDIDAKKLFQTEIKDINFIHPSQTPTFDIKIAKTDKKDNFYCYEDFLISGLLKSYITSYLNSAYALNDEYGNEIFMYTYSDEKDFFPKMNKETERTLFQWLVKEIKKGDEPFPRLIIPCLNRYKDLCVNIEADEFEFFSCPDCFKPAGKFLIFPSCINEIMNIENPTEDWFDSFLEKPEIKQLICYIAKNNHFTKKSIIKAGYIRLLKELLSSMDL